MIDYVLGIGGYAGGHIANGVAQAYAESLMPDIPGIPPTVETRIADIIASAVLGGVWLFARPHVTGPARTGIDIAMGLNGFDSTARMVSAIVDPTQTAPPVIPTLTGTIQNIVTALRYALLDPRAADTPP